MALKLNGNTIIDEAGKTLLELTDEVVASTNSIKNISEEITKIMNGLYPVGAIYMSVNDTNPKTIFAGTEWVQIKDRFLLACGDTYQLGATGGDASVTLSVANLPKHNHAVGTQEMSVKLSNSSSYTGCRPIGYSSAGTAYVGETGSGTAHNNMPPYLVVYVWRRIS